MTNTPTDERKKRYWGPERNAERRRRYREDPEHRKHIRQQVRESYVRSRMANGLEVREDDCRDSIDLLPDIGEEREVALTTGEVIDMLTLTTEELSTALNRSQQVIYRWHSAGLFPRPVVLARHITMVDEEDENGRIVKVERVANNNQPVYTHEEAAALMEVFGQHQETSQYYRKYHEKTRDKLFAAVEQIRNRLRVQGVPMRDEEEEDAE